MDINHERRITMPYKPFEPRDTTEAALSKLWGDEREAVATTRFEEMILKIAEARKPPESDEDDDE